MGFDSNASFKEDLRKEFANFKSDFERWVF